MLSAISAVMGASSNYLGLNLTRASEKCSVRVRSCVFYRYWIRIYPDRYEAACNNKIHYIAKKYLLLDSHMSFSDIPFLINMT